MRSQNVLKLLFVCSFAIAAGCGSVSSSSDNSEYVSVQPDGVTAESPVAGEQTAVFAGGCFWGVEAVFENLRGVRDVRSGYAGGSSKDANYDKVSNGETKHAEAVIVRFDPAKISYEQLLSVFFTVAHDPTQLDRQGPDVGPQYRSEIFYSNDEQRQAASVYIDQLGNSGKFSKPIVTKISALEKFYDAETYHQDFMRKNPNNPYIVAHDRPKLVELKKQFPDLYVHKYGPR